MRSCFLTIVFIFIPIFSYPQTSGKFSVKYVNIDGNLSFTKKEIKDIIKISEFREYDIKYIKDSVESLETFYRQNGYLLAKVYAYIDTDGILHIVIKEGIIEDTIFTDLDYLQIVFVRELFGSLKDVVFHKPSVENKLYNLKKMLRCEFEYDFISTEKDGYYILLLTKKKIRSDDRRDEKTYVDFYFNFRGWLLSLVPYFFITIYNIGGIDQSLRLGLDVRFATENWAYLKFRESVINEYYSANYFSPPIYKDFRLNLSTGIFINREGRGDIGIKYKIIRYPLELGGGFDFKYFWASLNAGIVYVKFRNPVYFSDSLVSLFPPYNYPEFIGEYERTFNTFSLKLDYVERKKYQKEKDNIVSFSSSYLYDKEYSWLSLLSKAEFFFIFDFDIIALRLKAFANIGKFPAYYSISIPEDFYLRGYLDEPVFTDRGISWGIEYWNSFYQDRWHTITFLDFAYFNNETYKTSIAMGDFAMNYGIGISYSFYELNLRFCYAVPIKQRADKGRFDFFFRRRF